MTGEKRSRKGQTTARVDKALADNMKKNTRGELGDGLGDAGNRKYRSPLRVPAMHRRRSVWDAQQGETYARRIEPFEAVSRHWFL